MKSLNLKAPAKINLNLQILNKKEDGYHNLKSVFQTIDLYDEILLTSISEGIQLKTSGKYKIPNNRDNLVYQVAEQLRVRANGKVGVKIELNKQIPLFAGLGGGSSDAGTVLQGLNQLWNLNLSLEKQIEIAKKIGADIPFFLYGGKCLVEGIGDKITPLDLGQEKHILIAQLPYIKVSTPWAYKQWDKLQITNYELGDLQNQFTIKKANSAEKKLHSNDFEKVIFPYFPDLKDLKEIFLQNGAIQANLTGSGSAIFGVFEEKQIAEKCLANIEKKCEFVYLGKTFNEE